MSNYMEYKDLRCKHINSTTEGKALYVTFSAWNSQGLSSYFGENFFLKNGIEAFLIAQNGVNHWWHSEEIYELVRIIKARSAETGKYIVLYGSSMGGYAACHFRELFGSKYSIAIAPQIFVDQTYFSSEKRWINELKALQSQMQFNEISNLNSQLNHNLYVFYDSMYDADAEHVKFYHQSITSSSHVNFIDVPYANHDVARSLNQAKILSQIVLSFNDPAKFFSKNQLDQMCSEVYLHDFKSFFNQFRKLDFVSDRETMNALSTNFNEYSSQAEQMDFEALYLLAECLMKLERYEEAINTSLQSIELYISKYSRPAPEYLRNKFKFIVKKALSVK